MKHLKRTISAVIAAVMTLSALTASAAPNPGSLSGWREVESGIANTRQFYYGSSTEEVIMTEVTPWQGLNSISQNTDSDWQDYLDEYGLFSDARIEAAWESWVPSGGTASVEPRSGSCNHTAGDDVDYIKYQRSGLINMSNISSAVAAFSTTTYIYAENGYLYQYAYNGWNNKTDHLSDFTKMMDNAKYSMGGSAGSSSSTGYRSSDWAKPEVANAISLGLVPSNLLSADLTQPINRRDFAAISVNVYESMSGKAISTDSNPFSDTSDSDVLKAYAAGIVNGITDTTFEPSSPLTREQAATMLTRAYKKTVFSGWTLGNDSSYGLSYTAGGSFADSYNISDYASESVGYMSAKGVINGMDNNTFEPQSTLTREQAIAIAVRMINKLDTSPQTPYAGAAATQKPSGSSAQPGVPQPANGTVTFDDDVHITFGSGNSGNVTMVKEASPSDKPDDTAKAVYDMALDNIPDEKVSFAFDAPVLTDGSQYLIQIGVPVKDGDGNASVIWSGIETTYSDGQAQASTYLNGISDYIESISGDGIAGLAPDLGSLAQNITGSSTGKALKVALTTEIVYTDGRFRLHVPLSVYVDPSDRASRAYFSDTDAQNVLDDMNAILKEYEKTYDISRRTSWPMDVYIGWAPVVAYFALPGWALGGRIAGDSAINDSYVKIKEDQIKNGYKKNNSVDYMLYGTLAHELFHFVQRCYYPSVPLGISRWWDESTSTYYDALMREKAGYTSANPGEWLDQNYWEPAIVQYEIIPGSISGGSDGDYAHMPFFHYCMKQDPEFLKKAFEARKKDNSKSYTSYIEAASGKTMAELTVGYYTSLVVKGELYSVKNKPWEIFDDLVKGGSTYTQFSAAVKPDKTQTVNVKVPAYGAGFVALDMKEAPANADSLNLSASGVKLIAMDITGTDYSNVSYKMYSDGKLTGIPIDGKKHLYMLINETGSAMNVPVNIELHTLTAQNLPDLAHTDMLSGTYTGTVSFMSGGVYYSGPATAELTVGSTVWIDVKFGDKTFTTNGLDYNASTGMAYTKVFVSPTLAKRWLHKDEEDTATFAQNIQEEETQNAFSTDIINIGTGVYLRAHLTGAETAVVFSGGAFD